MTERTEELGVAHRLPIVVGGALVELRTLNLEESERWQAKAAELIADFDLPETNEASKFFAAFAGQPSHVMLQLLLAYDVDKVLGTAAALRKRLTQAELYAAIKQMVTAELPFVTDAHSVAEAFGPQLRALAIKAMSNLASRPENSTSGPSPNGVSTLELSEVGSAKKVS